MIDTRTAPYAAFVLRVALGVLFLAHAGLKVFVFTPAGTAQFFASLGLPAGLAYLVIAAETLGGVALILGIYGRVVALALVPILLGAIFTVHGPAGFFFTNPMAAGSIWRCGSSRSSAWGCWVMARSP